MRQLFLLCTLFLSQIASATNPKLSFFNEQDGKELQKLFSDTSLIPNLKRLNAEIRMGMLDTSPERVEILKKLNEAGIPVVAWLLLPKEKGYWFHSGNSKDAFNRYYEIKKWAEETGIKFSGIGIDLELDMNELELFKTNKLKLLGNVIGRLYDKKEFLESKEQYKKLIDTIRKDGFTVESYYIPVIRYETEKGRTSLQQASRFMDLETYKEIPMLYTSFMGNPYGVLKELAIDENLKYVAIGSTGGGFDPSLPSMKWEDLAYDLRIASKTAKEIHIFCLEASVEKGFIPRLINFDYDVSVKTYPEQEKAVQTQIDRVMMISGILSYPTLMILSIVLILATAVWLIYFLVKSIMKKLAKH
jgi:hypothetical protein